MGIRKNIGQIAIGNGRIFQDIDLGSIVAIGIKEIGANKSEHSVAVYALEGRGKSETVTFDEKETGDMAFMGQFTSNGDRSVLLRIGGWIELGSEAVRNTLRQLVSSLMNVAGNASAFDERFAGLVSMRDAKYVLVNRDDRETWSNAIVTALTTDEGLPLDYATFDPTYTGSGVRITGLRGDKAYSIQFSLGGVEISRKSVKMKGLQNFGETSYAKIIDISRMRISEDGNYHGIATVGNRNASYSTRLTTLAFDQNGLIEAKGARALMPDYGAKLPILMFVGTTDLLAENGQKNAAFIRHRSSEVPGTAEIVVSARSTGNQGITLNGQNTLPGSAVDAIVGSILNS